MIRGAFASGRIAYVGFAIFGRSVSLDSRLDDAFHHASAKTGRVVAVWRRADHQEENLRAARPIRALPPLFAFVLHERDLRSFQRAASMNLFVACALTVPVLPRPKVFRPPKMIHCRLFGSLLTTSPKKDALRLRLRPAFARLVFIPNSRLDAATGYVQYRSVFDVRF
jgi:hypothetical protein